MEPAFKMAIAALRVCAEKPSDIAEMSPKEKKVFVGIFQSFDRLFAQLQSFTVYEEENLPDYGIAMKEYEDYVGHYLNVLEELKPDDPEPIDPSEPGSDDPVEPLDPDYELLCKENPKIADIMSRLVDDIAEDEGKYQGQSILHIVEDMKQNCIDEVIDDFCYTWYASRDDVMYAAMHYHNDTIPNESAIKATIDYQPYKAAAEKALPKFKYYAKLMSALHALLDEEIKPLVTH